MLNDRELILDALKPHKEQIVGIVIESTYNITGTGSWTHLAEAYKVRLFNPAAIKKYRGLKYADDQRDAFWMVEMLRLGILPEGYIYPKEERPVRDLLRKRMNIVKLLTSLIVSLQNIISSKNGFKLKTNI